MLLVPADWPYTTLVEAAKQPAAKIAEAAPNSIWRFTKEQHDPRVSIRLKPVHNSSQQFALNEAGTGEISVVLIRSTGSQNHVEQQTVQVIDKSGAQKKSVSAKAPTVAGFCTGSAGTTWVGAFGSAVPPTPSFTLSTRMRRRRRVVPSRLSCIRSIVVRTIWGGTR